MPTYNFKTGGEVEIDGQLWRTIEGPAVFQPTGSLAQFLMSYLAGSDLYYYSDNNTFQIDGEDFEGTIGEFCDAAEALYATAGGGGGGSYGDVTENTTATILGSTLAFETSEGKGILKMQNDDGVSTYVTVGDDTEATYGYAFLQTTQLYGGLGGNSGLLASVGFAGTWGTDFQMSASNGNSKIEIASYDNDNESNFNIYSTKFEFGGAPIILPTFTKAQRNALTPVARMMVYQSDNTPGLRVYNGTHWVKYTETNDD